MSPYGKKTILDEIKLRFNEIVEREGISDAAISVKAKALTPEEAIGNPGRRDFPILVGVERMIEASVLGARGHAFTDAPSMYEGTLGAVMNLDLSTNRDRAIFIATLNAVLRHLRVVSKTLHCKDDAPEDCAREIAGHLASRFGKPRVGLIGLNPAIAEGLVRAFGPENVRITDKNPKSIGGIKFGVEVWDASIRTVDLIGWADVILLTGTTLVNGTFDGIWGAVQDAGKTGIVYGVTSAGVCELAGMERICPYALD